MRRSMIGGLIAGPIGQVLGIILILIVYSLIAGAINGWYTQTVDAGVVAAERFDRVILMTTGDADADERWGKVSGVDNAGFNLGHGSGGIQSGNLAPMPTARAFHLTKSGTGCKVGQITGSVKGTGPPTRTLAAQTYYTPSGTEVTSSATTVAGKTSGNPNIVNVLIDGCEWHTAATVFKAGGLGAVITIVLQAAGLALPVGVLAMLGGFGGSLMRRFGGDALTTIIVAVVVVVLSAILFNYFVPFVEDAYNSIDARRFIIYDEGLGSLGVVVGNFWGVTLVASMMGVAWTLVQSLRPANLLHNRGRM